MAKNIVLLDFDGVLVNSAPECFKTCYDTIISFENLLTHNEAKSFKKIKKKELEKFFLYYRGIVGPPEHFFSLMMLARHLVEKKLNFNLSDKQINNLFLRLTKKYKEKNEIFKKLFFMIRKKNIKNIDNFMKLNKPTKFSNKLKLMFGNNWPIYILSSKDENTIREWLDFHKIKVRKIIGNRALSKYQNNKYNIVEKIFFTRKKPIRSGIFIDDFMKNLDIRFEKLGIQILFANWGYGKSSKKNKRFNINEINAIKKIKDVLSHNL